MMIADVVLADIGPGVAGVIVALIATAGGIAARWAPKTRSEAGVDRSQARVNDAQAWSNLFDRQKETIDDLRKELEAVEERCVAEIEAERRQCDEQMKKLIERIEELEAVKPQTRIWAFAPDEPKEDEPPTTS